MHNTDEKLDIETNSSQPKPWRGTSITDICKGKGHWSFAVSPVSASKYHCVLYELPVTLQGPPKPHYASQTHLWDDDHVRMPFSDKNMFPLSENGVDVIKSRWKVINEALSNPITTSYEFEAAVRQYNSLLPKFEALHYYFNEALEPEESNPFFSNLLPKIIKLALRLPELIPGGIPLLKQNHNRSLSMSQLQVACLLANAFLCTFPWRKNVAVAYPGVNFVGLFSSFARPKRKLCMGEKLKCIFNYFRRVTQNSPVGAVTFERKFIPRSSMPRWDTEASNLGNTRVHVSSTGTIEDDGLGFLQVDFANKNIGGGVLRYGCVQEEIRFVICPELLVSRLFVEQLGNTEAVIITGAERYNNYTGYGDTFEWESNHNDDTPYDVYGRRKTTICVIDATRFNKTKDQFHASLILRELNKAFVGFSSREKENLSPVATGNWGCGAFRGCKQLKILIQLMACTVAKRDMVYYSFGDEELMENFYQIHLFIANHQITVSQLWRFLCRFVAADLSEEKLYSFIQQAYFDGKKQPTISKYFAKQNEPVKEKPPPSAPSTSAHDNSVVFVKEPEISSLKESEEENKMHKEAMDIIEEQSSSSEDIIPSSQPELKAFKKVINLKQKKKSENLLNKLPKTDICGIFDLLDGNANQQDAAKSPDYTDGLSIFDTYSSQDISKTTMEEMKSNKEECNLPLEEVVVVQENKMEIDDNMSSDQKDYKKKITDYFIKTNKK